VVPGGINADATREIRVDLPYQYDHLARRFLLWIRVACKVSLDVAKRALDPQHLCEILHNEADIRVGRQNLQIFRRRFRSRPSVARRLGENGSTNEKAHNG
jgi:hypothetical protein